MIGFIYYIKNKENNKYYIGQTIDINKRLYRHFQELEKGTHHSTKLQRAYDKYGKTAFEVEYKQKEYKDYQELLNDEKKEIEKYNAYYDGYNCTLGGEGNSLLFDFNTTVLLYNIGKRHDGVKKKIARYFNCDHSSIAAIFNKNYLETITYSEEEVQELIDKIGITENNLKEKYKNNYLRQLTEEQVIKILSTMEIKKYSGAACGKAVGVKKDVVNGIMKGKTYKESYAKFLQLTREEKEKHAEDFCNSTDVIRLHYQGQRGPVKNPLTQEQVNYILDCDAKGMSTTTIAKELGISTDRIRKVRNRESYLDMIWVYEKILHN